MTTSAEATADTGIDADETVLARHSGEALSVVAATGAASASSIDASTESGPHCGGVVELRGKVERHGFNQDLKYTRHIVVRRNKTPISTRIRETTLAVRASVSRTGACVG